MSRALRLALVGEGPTDAIVVEAALRAILADRPFVLTQLQPEQSIAFGPLGGGWGGVYRWCKQAARQAGGQLGQFRLLDHFDLLILQLDADVADLQYQDANVVPDAEDAQLPCALGCPPVEATTNALRAVLLTWCGEREVPPRTVLCTPSKNTDTWLVAALFPNDQAVQAAQPFECHPLPAGRLAQQPKARRLRKTQAAYRENTAKLTDGWAGLQLSEARRFEREVTAAVPIEAP
jgi:hypothetical protein